MDDLLVRLIAWDFAAWSQAIGSLGSLIFALWATVKGGRGVGVALVRVASLLRSKPSPLFAECLTALGGEAAYIGGEVLAGSLVVGLEDLDGKPHAAPYVKTLMCQPIRLKRRELKRVIARAQAVRDRIVKEKLALADARALYELQHGYKDEPKQYVGALPGNGPACGHARIGSCPACDASEFALPIEDDSPPARPARATCQRPDHGVRCQCRVCVAAREVCDCNDCNTWRTPGRSLCRSTPQHGERNDDCTGI